MVGFMNLEVGIFIATDLIAHEANPMIGLFMLKCRIAFACKVLWYCCLWVVPTLDILS